MKTQEIGQSGMIASRVALGVMRMDALDAADAARTVAVAHDSGIDYFDTADIYGFHDHAAHASSKRFGQAWKDAGLDRSTIFIQTKFGIDYSFGENDGGANGYDFSAKHLIGPVADRTIAKRPSSEIGNQPTAVRPDAYTDARR